MASPNFFSGYPLNRLSHLRSEHEILNRTLSLPGTNILLVNKLNPFVSPSKENKDKYSLHYFKYDDINAYLPEGTSENPLENLRAVFLGIDQQGRQSDVTTDMSTWNGDAYWAIDITSNEKLIDYAYANSPEDADFVDLKLTPRPILAPDASIASTARSLLDWQKRYTYCAECGRKYKSIWGGWKLQCSGTLESVPPCDSRVKVQNFNYPRLDPVVITAILSADRKHILLGRKKTFPGKTYSCIAGFLEPGESIEEAVVREAYEETGVRVSKVVYHSSQPWPYPSSLMIGCFAIAEEDQPLIKLDIDDELEDARFFTRDEVLPALLLSNEKGKPKGERNFDGMPSSDDLVLTVPPPIAIANRLINAWIESGNEDSKL